LIAEKPGIVLAQASVLKPLFSRQMSTSYWDVWCRRRFEMSGPACLFQLDFAAPAGHGKMPTATLGSGLTGC
jgi:hypothetical protein